MKREEVEAILRKHQSATDREWKQVGDFECMMAILEAVSIQKQRDADLCRRLQVESRKRVELGFTCAKAIEEQDDVH